MLDPAAYANLARGFPTVWKPATAKWPGTPTTDSGGSITTPGTLSTVDCLVQIDAATQAMRAADDFLETDVRLLVLDIDALDESATITVGAVHYALQSVSRDPAGMGWDCRGRKL